MHDKRLSPEAIFRCGIELDDVAQTGTLRIMGVPDAKGRTFTVELTGDALYQRYADQTAPDEIPLAVIQRDDRQGLAVAALELRGQEEPTLQAMRLITAGTALLRLCSTQGYGLPARATAAVEDAFVTEPDASQIGEILGKASVALLVLAETLGMSATVCEREALETLMKGGD